MTNLKYKIYVTNGDFRAARLDIVGSCCRLSAGIDKARVSAEGEWGKRFCDSWTSGEMDSAECGGDGGPRKTMTPWEQHSAVISIPRFDYSAPASLLQHSHSGFLITCTISNSSKTPSSELRSSVHAWLIRASQAGVFWNLLVVWFVFQQRGRRALPKKPWPSSRRLFGTLLIMLLPLQGKSWIYGCAPVDYVFGWINQQWALLIIIIQFRVNQYWNYSPSVVHTFFW